MKWLFLCFIGISCFAYAFSERCYSGDDCREGECCTGGITPWIKGSCRPLEKEGDVCDPNSPDTGKYFMRCPCESSLKCVTKENVVGGSICVRE
nr:U9-ctenitoxin-Pr1a-like [Parasteatoda tepidariorum]